MEKRAVLAAAISLAVLLLYQEFVLPRFQSPPPKPLEISDIDQPEIVAAPAEADAEPPPLAAEFVEVEPEKPVAVVDEKLVSVETDRFWATFSTHGGRLSSLQLKDHRTSVEIDSPPLEMISESPNGERPLAVDFRGREGSFTDSGRSFQIVGGDLHLSGAETGELRLSWSGESGTQVDKIFRFQGDATTFSMAISAKGVDPRFSEMGLSWFGISDGSAYNRVGKQLFDRVAYVDGRKLIEDYYNDLKDGKVLRGDILWSGHSGRHFLSALIPKDEAKRRLWLKTRESAPALVEQKLLFPMSSQGIEQELDVYVGAKDIDTLAEVGHRLNQAVDFGWFHIIAEPMLHVLRLFHSFTGNYGIDIIILTILIKIIFLPLTQKSFQSMRAMQQLQPEMTKLREQYKDSPQDLNKEMMELYRRHKVNPLGGCLPMLLQIPVFIGLYQALINAVELRHAPFLLWINDLSAPDRLGTLQIPFVDGAGIPVLTLFMGATMFLQQWLSPAAGDPMQQRMMMILPLMFTFMFVNFPAGLVLYWLVNNILTIAQQYYINRNAA